jgi:succinate dehydrogenase / fumarate reductase cytochrome b subunit
VNERLKAPKRPLSPRLSIYRWQPAMIASIAHRASGIVLFLFVPLYLWLLHDMTGSPESFAAASEWLHSGLGKFSLWVVGTALIYHFCNGIRFLVLDAGFGETREIMRSSARNVIVIAAVTAIILAVLL